MELSFLVLDLQNLYSKFFIKLTLQNCQNVPFLVPVCGICSDGSVSLQRVHTYPCGTDVTPSEVLSVGTLCSPAIQGSKGEAESAELLCFPWAVPFIHFL